MRLPERLDFDFGVLLSRTIFCDDSQRVVSRWGFFSVRSLSRPDVLVRHLSSSLGCGHRSWAELKEISILPQFVPGRDSVVAVTLSRPNQVIRAVWTLHQEVFDWLRKRWPVTFDLFAFFLNHRFSVYFASVSDPMAAGTDAMLQSWDFLQAYAFLPFAMIPQVLVKLR